jgi:hypothetical protein
MTIFLNELFAASTPTRNAQNQNYLIYLVNDSLSHGNEY